MKKINVSSHLYCPTSAVVGAPATGPAGEPGLGAGFATRVGSGFKVSEPGWVRVAKFWNPGGSGFQNFATQVGPVHKEMALQTASNPCTHPGTQVTLEPGSGPC